MLMLPVVKYPKNVAKTPQRLQIKIIQLELFFEGKLQKTLYVSIHISD